MIDAINKNLRHSETTVGLCSIVVLEVSASLSRGISGNH
jgi:hypothetical protein